MSTYPIGKEGAQLHCYFNHAACNHATTKGHVLLVGEARKLTAHADTCREVGVSFVPWSSKLMGGRVPRPLVPTSDAFWANAWTFLQPNPPAISSSGAPFLYGKAMLQCGHAISLSKPSP